MNPRVISISGWLCIAPGAGCIEPRSDSDRPGHAPAARVGVGAAAIHTGSPTAPVPHPGDDPATARVRAWLQEQIGTNPYVDGPIVRTPEHDTAQVQCVRITPNGAPDPARASRVVCVAGNDVLAGEAGFQRYLHMHEFDPVLAQPAARVLLNLRDQMLGFTGRTYTDVQARVEADALIIDASGNTRTNSTAPAIPRRWRVTIAHDGTTSEQLITANADAGTTAVVP